MIKEGVYRIDAKNIVLPADVSVSDYIFGNKEKDLLINSNHAEEIVVIKKQEGLVDYGYNSLKKQLRSNYRGRTVFAIVENGEEVLEPLGTIEFSTEWLVAALDEKMYYHGDLLRSDVSPDDAKIADVAKIACKTITGKRCDLYVVISSASEMKYLQNVVKYKVGSVFNVKGMDMWIKRGSTSYEKRLFASEICTQEPTYERVPKMMPHVNSVDDVTVWRDLLKDEMICSEVESSILTSSLFFSYEGFAAINLIMLGEPGCGKSHQMDTFAFLLNTKNHNCTETTIKGLIFSHAEKGGMPGILYRERFVALLNEFIRIVGSVASSRQVLDDQTRRMLSTLNDAVEKKRDRSRSSGKVEGADATMICSMLTSDNYYPSVVGPLAKAMIQDSSYVRRYSFMRLSAETHKRGREHSKVSDWRAHTMQLLEKKHLGSGRWAELMMFWRSQIPLAMNCLQGSLSKYERFARKYTEQKIDEMFFEKSPRGIIEAYPELEKTYVTLKEANLYQLVVACVVSGTIMQSTFIRREKEFPIIKQTLEGELMGLNMFQRLVEDLFELLKPYVEEIINSETQTGIRREKNFGGY